MIDTVLECTCGNIVGTKKQIEELIFSLAYSNELKSSLEDFHKI